MFRPCDECIQWAQWRGAVKDKDGTVTTIRHLCQIHKDWDRTPNIKFIFVGAVPTMKANT